MYDYSYGGYGNTYDYGYETASSLIGGLAVFMFIVWLITIGISVFTLISMWKVFKKAGKPGWAAIVPIYNIIVMLEIAELPMWYIALYFVPVANIYATFKVNIEIAHKFGKSTGFGIGMAFLTPIFLAILAFSKNVNYGGVQNVVQSAQPINTQPTFEPTAPVMPQPEIQPVAPVVPEVQPTPIVEPQMPAQPEIQPMNNVVNQSNSPAFCTNCGNALLPNAKFCTNCGKQI